MFNEHREQAGKLILARLIYLSVTARQVGYKPVMPGKINGLSPIILASDAKYNRAK